MAFLHDDLTSQILDGAFKVAAEQGTGFLESVYQNALAIVLAEKGLEVACEAPLPVVCRDKIIGNFKADMIVNSIVLIELKAVNGVLSEHKAQVINYLKTSGLEVGLLINFGRARIEYFRLEHLYLHNKLPVLKPNPDKQ